MTIGAVVLMALDDRSPSGGAFSLASYTNLNPIEQVAMTAKPADISNWERIEICYSGTQAGNVEQMAGLAGLTNGGELDFHFVVCNGRGASDGHIQATERWRWQRPCLPSENWYGSDQTIRICMIADGSKTAPTDCQVKRTAALAEALARKFNISPRQILYPSNWQL
jgi:hypothetical protein